MLSALSALPALASLFLILAPASALAANTPPNPAPISAPTPATATAPAPIPVPPPERGAVRVYTGTAGGNTAWGTTTATSANGTVVTVAGSPVAIPARPFPLGAPPPEVERETVPFLGVETAPVGATLAAQLNLTSGAGLVVSHVLPDSPAAATLKVHDILLKLDDQILIESRQLAVLIRQRKTGDDVTLTYLRGGKEASAKLKLSQHDVPKLALWAAGVPVPVDTLGFAASRGGAIEIAGAPFPPTTAPASRGQIDGMLSLVQARQGQPFTVRIDQGGPAVGVRGVSIDRGNSSLFYNDDDGALELTIKDGKKSLVAKNAQGAPLFSGPVTTDDERKALPEVLRTRLEKLEGMQDVTFRTDGDFQGAETKVVRPLGRGVSFPVLVPTPLPLAPHPFF